MWSICLDKRKLKDKRNRWFFSQKMVHWAQSNVLASQVWVDQFFNVKEKKVKEKHVKENGSSNGSLKNRLKNINVTNHALEKKKRKEKIKLVTYFCMC